jgi:hypothetical protein
MFNTLYHAQYAANGNLLYRDFYLKFYSWVTPPNLSTLNPLTEEYVCFSDDAQLPGTYALNAAYDDNRFTDIRFEHEQYIEEFRPFQSDHRAPIQM